MPNQTQILDQMQSLIDQIRPTLPPYYAISDRTIRPKPKMAALNPAGFTFYDPSFGSVMLRVTDGSAGSGSFHVPSNSNLAAWSADSRKFYVMNSGGGVLPYVFSPAGMTAVPLPFVYSQVEPQFSRVNPDTLFTVGGPMTRTIRKYSFATKSFTDVLDLDTLGLPDLVDPRTYIGGIMTGGGGMNENLMVFFGGTSQDRHHYAVWFPLSSPGSWKLINTLGNNGTSTPPFHLHSAAIDLSGRYVLLGSTNADIANGIAQIIVWDTLNGGLTPLTAAMHPYGHGVCGYGTWINQDQGDEGLPYDGLQWQIRDLSNLSSPKSLISVPMTPKSVSIADHTNWNHAHPDNSNPPISAIYRYGNNTTEWRAWDDEIVGIPPVPGGPVYRFCHHRSLVDDDINPVNPYFWYQPILNVSPDGKWCLFTSNWDKTLGLDPQDKPHYRQDVFMVQLA